MKIEVTEQQLMVIVRALNIAADYYRCDTSGMKVITSKQFNSLTVEAAELADTLEAQLP